MRTIGLLGGMTWVSSAEYYRLLNTGVNERLGGVHSARCVLVSVDMGEIGELMAADRWDEAGRRLAVDARAVEAAGADLFLLATNSLHNVWDAIVADLTIPTLHIADATANALRRDGHTRGALLGTRYTMELPFLRGRLADRYGMDVLVPEQAERELVHRAVFEELALGVFADETRAMFVDVIRRLAARGATAAILGCTEFGLLLRSGDADLPLYDTARLHAAAAVETPRSRRSARCAATRHRWCPAEARSSGRCSYSRQAALALERREILTMLPQPRDGFGKSASRIGFVVGEQQRHARRTDVVRPTDERDPHERRRYAT